jgi:lipopolysaccharide transport system ATP-binding protein
MSDISIHAEHLSKQFRIGAIKNKRSFLDAFTDGVKTPFRKAGQLFRGRAAGTAEPDDTIWALKDLSFDIKQGEVVGIIGRNGAGKSTVLKILSRITEPTTGFAEIRGRVGSLLEVGTGFHPELTGRENILLSGSILGMKKSQIRRVFDAIVDFAEVEKFVDTPVKHYSSGMYLRLAFAVAAHLEPEILLVDEVLAVGDSRFQKRCLSKMEDVGKHGRTVLFVSHDMQAVTRLCPRVIFIDGGVVAHDGPANESIKKYMASDTGLSGCREWPDPATAPSGDVACLRAARVRTEDGLIAEAIDIRRPFTLEMEFDVLRDGYILLPHFVLVKATGEFIFVTVDVDPAWRGRKRPVGRYKSTALIPGNLLSEGMIFVQSNLRTLTPDTIQFWARDVVAFQMIDTLDGDSARGDYAGDIAGAVRPLLKWTTEHSTNELST